MDQLIAEFENAINQSDDGLVRNLIVKIRVCVLK